MSCSPYDLRDYFFNELAPAERTEVRAHLKTCAPCTTELDTLGLTQSALLSIRDEEMPQRIGFVSDKVFEPSPLRRWVGGFWTSAARLGFVSSAILAGAILVHTLHNPAQSAPPAPVAQAELDRRIEAAVNARVHAAVTQAVSQAVAEADQNAQKRTTELLAAEEHRHRTEQQTALAEFQAERDYLVRRHNVSVVAANYAGGAQ